MEHADGDERTGGLFSRQATDNAEVVPPSAPRTHDELWSTEVGDDEAEDDDGLSWGEDAAREQPIARPASQRNGDVFSAEPVERDGDVLDEAVDEPPASLQFGLGGDGPDPSLWRDISPPDPTRRSAPDWSVLSEESRTDAAAAPAASGREEPLPEQADVPAADPNGFEAAVRGIDPSERERATVPLVIAGALLLPGELVEEVVTGSMLGSPAVLVLTGARVLVVNERRWQPVVDIYRLDHRLTVRGRADRGVAALSVADEDRLSIVDGITDTEGAVAVADRIRDAVGGS